MNDLVLEDQDSIDGDDMGLLDLFEDTEENNHSLVLELLNEGPNETSNEEMVPKTQGMLDIHYVYYSYC